MSEPNILLLLVVICSGLLAHIATSQPPTKPTNFNEECDDFHDDYDYYSNHSSNVRTLLEELKKQANKTSFFNSSAGSGEDKVYGQYYCRADIDSDLCAQCIDKASHNHCIGGNFAVVLYEECTLRYDNQSMVGIYNGGEDLVFRTSSILVTDSEKFDSVLNNTLERIISNAANANGSLSFATGEGVVSESETVYCLAQCSPDLDDTQCDTCLHSCYSMYRLIDATPHVGNPKAIEEMSGQQSSWASMFESSCQLRYSNHGSFYGPIPSPHVLLAPQSPESPHVTAARGKEASYYVVRAVIPAAVIGSLTILGIFLCLIQQRHKAWREWNGGAIERLMDPIMQNNYSRMEAERCLQIGLLCVQDDATCRPTMHAVLLMLNSNTVDLPPPLSPSHYNYINKVSSDDGTQESTLKQQENRSSLSSTTFSAHRDLYAR
ncbi:hypothetical protein V2J09_002702 [Rumex salicifolius]